MGCDIHGHIEIRYKGEWVHYSQLNINWNYQLFSKMAGVRSNNNYDNNEFPISLPKGIPGNISIVTKIDYERWGCDAHSASWFNEEEIDRLKEWLKRYYPSLSFERDILHYTYLFGSELTDFKHYNDCIVEGVDSIRLIFWFDN